MYAMKSLPLLPILFLALFAAGPALAQSLECDLSKQPFLTGACPAPAVGAASLNPKFNGGTVDPKTDARTAIDAFGYCRYVGNGGDKVQFVPFGSDEEWHAYLTNHAPDVYLTQCSRGGNLQMPPNFGSDGVTNQCFTTPPVQMTYAPYKPANQPGGFNTQPITYECKAKDGTPFTETAVATMEAHDSGYGPSDDLGWKITSVRYAYNGVCGPAKGVDTKTAPTEGLCSVGVPGQVIGIGPFQWICTSGNGGGKNITCSTSDTCNDIHKVDEKPCQCENGSCFRPTYWADDCGHSWMDKSLKCDKPEPAFKPLPPIDYDNDHLIPR